MMIDKENVKSNEVLTLGAVYQKLMGKVGNLMEVRKQSDMMLGKFNRLDSSPQVEKEENRDQGSMNIVELFNMVADDMDSEMMRISKNLEEVIRMVG